VANSVKKGFENFNLTSDKIKKLVDQGLIFYIITLLVSYSRSLALGKTGKKEGNKVRRELIKNILADADIVKAAKSYSSSTKESKWIPLAISFKSRLLLEFACDLRAKEVIRKRSFGQE
jgi:hypothetical protein